ncbi:MAG: flavin reductase, partial [Bacillales bacterium]|nr:flavin reductase [Bacillales bacterium]
MAKTVLKPGTLLAPVPPVLVSCGTVENPNVMTIGWTGIINTRPPMTYISVRPERYSYNLIKDAGEFVINIPTEKLVFAVDYCGVRSG